MRLCDRTLRRWYREANTRWFEGKLPDDVDVLYAPHAGCVGIAGQSGDSFFIQVNPAYAMDVSIVKLTLLHEMAHVALWPYRTHGPKFQQEMLRLANAGAMNGKW